MFKRRILPLSALLALLVTGGLAAQTGAAPEKQAPAQKKTYPGSHITGTVVYWNGDRMDLKTPEGKTQKVAVNKRTERLVEVQKGAEVTVDYLRKIGDFIIALRVRPAEEGQTAKPAGPAAQSATGTVVSSSQSELVLRTDSGDVTFFLSPATEYEVKPLHPGLRVTLEYQVVAGGSKLVSRVLPAEAQDSKPASGSGAPQP